MFLAILYLQFDSILQPLDNLRLHDLLDISPTISDAVDAIADASILCLAFISQFKCLSFRVGFEETFDWILQL
ncbi:hypothetical protein L1887_05459 [Cichorium endivia]|nr:hypothetical protein L1887_05459 [Cichorium endivia]